MHKTMCKNSNFSEGCMINEFLYPNNCLNTVSFNKQIK